MKALFNDVSLYPADMPADTYDKRFAIPPTEGWQTIDLGLVQLNVGENRLRFYNGGQHQENSLMVDAFILEQVD